MIKAKDIIESVIQLNERNVINTHAIDQYISSWIDPFTSSDPRERDIIKWVKSTVRKYLINDYEDVWDMHHIPVETIERAIKVEPWIKQAIDRGEEVYAVGVESINEPMEHALDYIHGTYKLDLPDLPHNLKVKDLTRLSVPDALKKADDWTDWLHTRKVGGEADEGEEEIVRLSGGFTAVEVKSEAALDREGKLMQHCVGSYAEEVAADNTTIFSIRDSQNKPHVTIEYKHSRNEVVQIKGKQNEPPVEKYIEPTLEFLNYGLRKGWFKHIYELGNLSAVKVDGVIYRIEDAPQSYKITVGFERAVRNGDRVKAQEYLELGASAIEPLPGRQTPILVCSHWGDPDIVKMLLDRGASVNDEDSYGRTPLFNVSDVETARLLLDHGADVNHIDKSGKSPLSSIACGGATKKDRRILDIIKLFVSKGADINILPHTVAVTPLGCAVSTNDLALIKFFLDKGADPNEGDPGYEPLRIAAEQENKEVMQLLLDHGALKYAMLRGRNLDILEFDIRDYGEELFESSLMWVEGALDMTIDFIPREEVRNHNDTTRLRLTGEHPPSGKEFEYYSTFSVTRSQKLKELSQSIEKNGFIDGADFPDQWFCIYGLSPDEVIDLLDSEYKEGWK